jgi:hypothetical protein
LTYFLVVVVDDIVPVAGAAAGAAGALASAAGGVVVVVVVDGAVAEASAAGGVAAAGAAAESVAVVVVVEAASSAFFWQAERLRARPAATATEVMIRMFMERLPWRTMEDDPPTMGRLLHGFVSSRNRDHSSDAIFRRSRGGFRTLPPLAPETLATGWRLLGDPR